MAKRFTLVTDPLPNYAAFRGVVLDWVRRFCGNPREAYRVLRAVMEAEPGMMRKYHDDRRTPETDMSYGEAMRIGRYVIYRLWHLDFDGKFRWVW